MNDLSTDINRRECGLKENPPCTPLKERKERERERKRKWERE